MEPAQSSWLNILHLHGRDIHYSLLSTLDSLFPIVNWHDRETRPNLADAQSTYKGVVCGGLRQDTLVYKNPAEIQNEANDACQQTGGRRFILSTGCVVPIIAPHGNILAARHCECAPEAIASNAGIASSGKTLSSQ